MLHLFSSFVVLTRLWQEMMTNATFIVVFCFSYETKAKHNNEHTSSLFFFFSFPCIAKNNDESPHSSSSSTIQEKKNIETQKRTASLPTHHHPLQPKKKNLDVGFSWVARDDDEPPNSSLSLSFFSSFLENNDEPRDSSSSLGFFFKCKRRQ